MELPFYEEGGDMRSLMATWVITWIGSPLCKKPYDLFSNVEEVYEEMDGMVELLRDASAMQKY